MQIEWTAEEREILRDAHDAAEVAATSIGREVTSIACQRQTSEAVASCAVRLFLGRASGQVAEDMARLEKRLEPMDDKSRAAFHRLSALAQESEALEVAEQEVKALRAKVEALVKESALFDRHLYVAREERDVGRTEVVGAQERSRMLLDAKNHWSERARAAESRLASIRTRAAKAISECRGEGAREILRERLGWVLDGDAANSSTQSNGSGKVGHASTPGQCSNPDPTTGPTCAERGCEGRECRYPCSPTCTHDDAATPGHPERVKERSKALNAIPTATPDPYDWGRSDGIEAMRAACLRDVLEVYRKYGGCVSDQDLKSAIQGAKP